MPRKKSFIDKKNAVTFHLVHRSQKDPLQASEDAPQKILLPAKADTESSRKRKEKQREFGVFYDDDYDYLQHLVDVNEINNVEPIESFRIRNEKQPEEQSKLHLPSTLFASKVETSVGLLNKATPLRGPQPDWDPDIVAGLDDDFDFANPDNQLEDDFVALAMDSSAKDNAEEDIADTRYRGLDALREMDDESDDYASDEAEGSDASYDDEDGSDHLFMQEETKSRFTNYSMTSSVIRRNEGLTLLDDKFEKLYEQYDDEEIGALDDDEIKGCLTQNSELMDSALAEYEEEIEQVELKDAMKVQLPDVSESESEEEMITIGVEEKPKEQWDCESILSTYSNLYNHPKLIEEAKKVKPIKMIRIGDTVIPSDVFRKRGLSQKQLQQLEEPQVPDRLEYIPTYRPKDETPEERRHRKKLIKEYRRARRIEKKATKIAFKSEHQKQAKELLNARKSQGIKML